MDTRSQSQITQNVRLQNLRDFTVQIHRLNSRAVVGTGIAVSTDGKIVTCAHVVQAAGIDPRNANGREVGVYFPQARAGEEKNRRATVAKYFEDYEDDIVLLQLTEGSSPLDPEQIAVLGSTGNLRNREFDSFGYRSLGQLSIGKFIAGAPAHGKILGAVELLEGSKFHKEPLMLESNQLNAGMSGAGVLDVEDNLLVGIVSHVYDPDATGRDRDAALGVDARVLPLPPFDLPFRTEPLLKSHAPESKFDKEQAQAAVFIKEKFSWNNAPAVLTEWTGRDHLLAQITADWTNPQKHVTGLIGFGGEGKSSLARKWVDNILNDSSLPQPDSVFWWGFYENRSVDEFLEAALNYMSGGRIDPRAVPSSNLRAQIIGAMLGKGRYLFVLDGFEVLQHQEGDQYGLLQSNDLRDLLTYVANPNNQSFCLITSRAPLLDLMDYTTYTHRDVERLSEEDGRALLGRLGVMSSASELNKVVSDWDGHALTLSILAAYLAERYEGDIKHLADIPVPTVDEPRYERVHRVLRRYDEHLTKDEREFLKLFSVFRLPVQESAFEKVFEPLLKSLNKQALLKLVSQLANYRLICHDEREKSYTTHPLIRNHYFALFTKGGFSQEKATHEQIKDYYISIAGDTPKYSTLDDLKPLIEVVYHACKAGAYDEAWQIFFDRVYRGRKRKALVHEIGATATTLDLLTSFFPSGDITQELLVSNRDVKRFILNEIGLRLVDIGNLDKATSFYKRALAIAISMKNWREASSIYQDISELYTFIGNLEDAFSAAEKAVGFAKQALNTDEERYSIVKRAWILHLKGNVGEAQELYKYAERLEKILNPEKLYLFSLRGVQYADHLRRIGELALARTIILENLRICEKNRWTRNIVLCHRLLGDLDTDSNNMESASSHFEYSVKMARSITRHHALIESLLARGKFLAKTENYYAAQRDLSEALESTIKGGYRIYETDVRVALGWAYLANDEKQKAKQSAERALQMSNKMGYYWGKVDALDVLDVIARSGDESKSTKPTTSAKTRKISKPKGKRRSNLK